MTDLNEKDRANVAAIRAGDKGALKTRLLVALAVGVILFVVVNIVVGVYEVEIANWACDNNLIKNEDTCDFYAIKARDKTLMVVYQPCPCFDNEEPPCECVVGMTRHDFICASGGGEGWLNCSDWGEGIANLRKTPTNNS